MKLEGAQEVNTSKSVMIRKKKAADQESRTSETHLSAQPPQRPLLAHVQALLPSLKPVERQIAEYVLDDPERVLSSSISDMRRGSGASVGSIVGFCRLMGAKGFAEFKIALARELAQAGFSSSAKGSGDLANVSQFESVFQFHTQCLKETLQLNPEETVLKASRILEMARKIEFFSIGISYPVALTACSKLRLIGLPASTQSDAHLQIVHATQLSKGDVAFGISCSGRTRETVHCLKIARERKATTLCLTNCMKSPITEFADLALFASPSEIKYFQAPLASRITQLALIDVLFVSIALRRKNRTTTRLQIAGQELLEHRI